MSLVSKKPWIEKRIRSGDALHPKKIIHYFSSHPFEVKKLTQTLLGSQYDLGVTYEKDEDLSERALEQTELSQLFKDLQQLNGIQLQHEISASDSGDYLVGIGPEPTHGALLRSTAHLTIHSYDNEPGTEIGIEIEYDEQTILAGGMKIRRENKQYASFAYTGADTYRPFAINWKTEPEN